MKRPYPTLDALNLAFKVARIKWRAKKDNAEPSVITKDVILRAKTIIQNQKGYDPYASA